MLSGEQTVREEREKCEFHVSSIKFLGHVFKRRQVKTDPGSWSSGRLAHADFKKTTLWFTDFYHCFVRTYSQVIVPLIQLTSPKVPFQWSVEALMALSICYMDRP